MKKISFAFFFLLHVLFSQAQNIDHWETIIVYTDIWHYKIGNSAPPSNWKLPNFNTNAWEEGIGGIGYGDDDDNTEINPTLSLYMRRDFEVVDTNEILTLLLSADYDDAFVAYINGVEIARNNIGIVGIEPAYNEASAGFHEATFFNGEVPEAYFVSKNKLSSMLQQGTNTLAIQVHNENMNSSDLTSNFFLSAGLASPNLLYSPTPIWFVPPIYFYSTDLPLLIIETDQGASIPNEPKIPAHLGIVDKGQDNSLGDNFTDYDGDIAIEIRGTSSQGFPKKGYGFETRLADGSNNNVELLGLPKENDWILHAPYSDKSLIRNHLAYYMSAKTGQYAPRTRLVELVLNTDYQGVYLLTEKIKRDKNRVDIATLNPEDTEGDELTGGYVFKIDWDNPTTEEDGWFSNTNPSKFYAFQDPYYNELVPEQKAYLESYITLFESQMKSTNYELNYKNFVDVDSWIDYFLITEIGKHIDAYKLSFYMYKKKNSNGGKIHFGPQWDFNIGFGNFDFACSPDPQGWSYDFQGACDFSQPFWIKKLVEVPQVAHQTKCRWQALRAGPLDTDSLMAYIDTQVALLEAPQKRNFQRWSVLGEYVWPNDFVGDSYEEEIAFLKQWLTFRLAWMDGQMPGDCAAFVHLKEERTEHSIQVYPNPASDVLRIDRKLQLGAAVLVDFYDLSGRLIATFPLEGVYSDLNMEQLPRGMYFYKIRSELGLLQQGKLSILR